MPTPFTAKNGVGIGKVCTFFWRRGIFPLELPGPITMPEKEGLAACPSSLVPEERDFYEDARRRLQQNFQGEDRRSNILG